MERFFKFLFILSITFIFSQTICNAADVVLKWDPNTEPDLAGYKIYYDIDADCPYNGTGAIYYNGQEWVQSTSPIIIPLEILSDKDNPEVELQGFDSLQSYYFAVTAFGTEMPESGYSNEVSTASNSSQDIVPDYTNGDFLIDNGDNGTSSTGRWLASEGADAYGDSSFYSKQAGARYTFESSDSGYYEVSLWWTYYDNRCNDIPVEIYDGDTLLDTVYVNQLEDGGKWNILGSYEFSEIARVVIISEGDCSTNADAVIFVYQSINMGDNSTSTQDSYRGTVFKILIDFIHHFYSDYNGFWGA